MAESLWQRWRRGSRRVWQHPCWEQLLGPGWEEGIFELPVTDDFHTKQGRSTGRLLLGTTGQTTGVYLKRHYHLPWWRGLLALLWPDAGWSPALAEWRHLEWARSQGLPVPRPLAAGEYIGPGCRLQSFLAVEELAGMLPLHRAVPLAADQLSPALFLRWKQLLTRQLARLVQALHRHRHFHQDLYLCHFFLPEGDTRRLPAAGRLWLIDLHRLVHRPWTSLWWQAKDIGQLLYSSYLPQITARDRLRFWRAYLGAARRRWWGHALARCIRLRAWSNWRHNHKHDSTRNQQASPARAAG
jgi:hypothetical protein